MNRTEHELELMRRYLEGVASLKETQELEALIVKDASVRQDFLRYTHLDSALAGVRRSQPSVVVPRRFVWLSWRPIAAAAALVIGAFVLYSETSERLGHPGAVARFGQLDGCRWMDPATRVLSGDGIAVGQRVELSAGRAELHFATGARVTLLGPAIFEPRSPNGGFLTLGEVRVTAETVESKGFVLATPTSNFVDIGTAFTAGVSADGLSRLEVTEGIVDVVFGGPENARRLRAGETMYVEPGEKKVLTRIEAGEGTAAFRFPSIGSPTSDDHADASRKRASIRVLEENSSPVAKGSGGPSVLLDGSGQSAQDAPRESLFFESGTTGVFLIDLGQEISVSKINCYSWHQHEQLPRHRDRARQRYTVFGMAGNSPAETFPLDSPEEAGWTRIARVNSDRFFHVDRESNRPAQQASSITAEKDDIGTFRYLLWVVDSGTFYGEIDVFSEP
jgi:hypothetical protein